VRCSVLEPTGNAIDIRHQNAGVKVHASSTVLRTVSLLCEVLHARPVPGTIGLCSERAPASLADEVTK
jgi:hypothetical protein